MMGEIEQGRQLPRRSVRVAGIRKLGLGVADFVEKGVHQSLDGGETLCGSVLQEARNEVEGRGLGTPEDLSGSAG